MHYNINYVIRMKWWISLTFMGLAILMACKDQDCTTPVIHNRDINVTSELQLTMRNMYDYFEEVKTQLNNGTPPDEVKKFEHLLTDSPTEPGKNESDLYKAMAQNYLIAVDNMNDQKSKEAFNQIVDTCMSCHQQVCPGPMVRIKKLYPDAHQ